MIDEDAVKKLVREIAEYPPTAYFSEEDAEDADSIWWLAAERIEALALDIERSMM